MPLKLSNDLKSLLKKKQPEFIIYMCENSTHDELTILYKLLHYRNIEIDDVEQIIVETYSKAELSEQIYKIIHQRRFWNVQTIVTCVTLLINSHMWWSSFKKIRNAYKSRNQSKLSLLTGAGFVLHSLFVISDLNSLRLRNNTSKRQKSINHALMDLHLQKAIQPTKTMRNRKNRKTSTTTRRAQANVNEITSKKKTKQRWLLKKQTVGLYAI